MFPETANRFHRCFISAPFGLNLGALPDLLLEKGISWEWAKETPGRAPSAPKAVRDADFFIGILNGSRADIRVTYEAGIAVGLDKPVLLIMTRERPLPLDQGQFLLAKVRLQNRSALAFHLEIFLAAPRRSAFAIETSISTNEPTTKRVRESSKPDRFFSELEQLVYQIVQAAGGTVQTQPAPTPDGRYRPDFLMWLGQQEPQLLDPAVIEVKARVDRPAVRKIEEQLLSFMSATGVQTGLIITSHFVPELYQPLSPNLFWLNINRFEELVRTSRLGDYLRDTRNRLVHGAR